jgi:hypothetical protein
LPWCADSGAEATKRTKEATKLNANLCFIASLPFGVDFDAKHMQTPSRCQRL